MHPSRLVALLSALPNRLVLLCRLVMGPDCRLVALESAVDARLVASSLQVLVSRWIALVSDLHASLGAPSRLVVPRGQMG